MFFFCLHCRKTMDCVLCDSLEGVVLFLVILAQLIFVGCFGQLILGVEKK